MGRGAPRFPAQRAKRADVGLDVARVAEAVLAGHHSRPRRPVLAHHDVREFPGGDRMAAADVEDPPTARGSDSTCTLASTTSSILT